MTAQMERNKKTPLLCLLYALLYACAVGEMNCPSALDNVLTDLTCYSDYNRSITCMWNSTHVSDDVCTIVTKRKESKFGSSSCKLEPVDGRSTLKTCTLIYGRDRNVSQCEFNYYHIFSINVSCEPGKQNFTKFYKPACHIKLNPPRLPHVNFTSVSWLPQVVKNDKISGYESQLQWKQGDQSWSDPFVLKNIMSVPCIWNCAAELNPDWLIQDERYEARVRVKADEQETESIWSEWSPTASWVSPIGRTKQPPPSSALAWRVFGFVAGATVFAVLLVIVRFKADTTSWVYIVKRIRGPALPNPADSFLRDANFQTWLSPHFTGEYLNSFFKPEEIVYVEVTSTVDAVTPCGPSGSLLQKIRSENSSNFSNPSYSQLCHPPVSSLTAGNLAPCVPDTPYGPLRSQGEGGNVEPDRDEVSRREVELRQLLSKASSSSEAMLVISDYKKTEKLLVERLRLQSLDSGVCSGEEVSQESLEVDSIIVADEGPEGEEEREGGSGEKVDFHKFFGGSGGIPVCSGYEQVHKLQPGSLEAGVSSPVKRQASQDESLEDVDKSSESTRFLFPPPPTSSPCSLPSFTPLPLDFSGPGLSAALRPPSGLFLERTALMSSSRPVEPSGDGYMPVTQEQS